MSEDDGSQLIGRTVWALVVSDPPGWVRGVYHSKQAAEQAAVRQGLGLDVEIEPFYVL
jgi:hypothetical protein